MCIALLEPKEAAAEQLSSQLGQVPSDLPSLGPQSELDAKMRAAAVQVHTAPSTKHALHILREGNCLPLMVLLCFMKLFIHQLMS